jgi:REP element-mobilizing transposase RayT
MSRFERASHVIWHCQYHLVWVPKYRFRMLQGPIGREVQRCVMTFCQQRGCEIVEMNVQADHVHLLVKVPPRLSISERPERTYCDSVVQCISEFAQEAVLGQSLLGQGLLRRYGGTEQ